MALFLGHLLKGGHWRQGKFLPKVATTSNGCSRHVALGENGIFLSIVRSFEWHSLVTGYDGLDRGDGAQILLRAVGLPNFAYRTSWCLTLPCGAPDVFCSI